MAVCLMRNQKNLTSSPIKITQKIECKNFTAKNPNSTTGKSISNQVIINPLNLSKPVGLIDF